MKVVGRKGAAFTAVWMATAAGFFCIQSRPVVDRKSFDRALETPPATRPFMQDGIDFFENRLRARKGNDDLARSRLVGLYMGRFKISGSLPDLDTARKHLDSLLRHDSSDERLYIKLSALDLSEHRFSPALEAAQKAVDLSGSGSDSHDAAALALFDALFAIGRYGEASRQLGGNLMDSGSAAALTRKVRMDAWSGKTALAEAELEAACKDALAGASAPSVLAWCAVELADYADRAGKPRKAMARYREALVLVPGYPPALEGMGRLAYGRDHNLHMAKVLWEKALRYGGHLSIYMDLLKIEKDSGNIAESLKLKSRFIQAATASPTLERMYFRSLAMAELDYSERRPEALRYALLDNENRQTVESYDVLAWAYFRDGSIINAFHASKKALELSARDPSVLYRAALISWHAGNRTQADTLMQSAVKAAEAIQKNGGSVSGFPPALSALGNDFGRALSSKDLLAFHTHD